jgi:hypothetical protein
MPAEFRRPPSRHERCRQIFTGPLGVELNQTFGQAGQSSEAFHPHLAGSSPFENIVRLGDRISCRKILSNIHSDNDSARDRSLSSAKCARKRQQVRRFIIGKIT